MTDTAVSALCPVCGFSVATPFFDGGLQTLATLGWPPTSQSARQMPRYPHDFVQCPRCTHVWNRSFTYDAIPYKNNPNRMFNRGSIWSGHLAHTRDLLLRNLPASPTVVEIGCGEGHFIRGLAAASHGGRYLGFDINAAAQEGEGVEFHARLFDPLQDIAAFQPDALIIRHLLEHLEQPAQLLEQVAWAASRLDKPVWLFTESPCIDRVFESGRLADFFYEHVSHFTRRSFLTLMERAGKVEEFELGYDGEVIFALVLLEVPKAFVDVAETAADFAIAAQASRNTIRSQLDQISASGARVAIWGGSGKATAFINQFGADAGRFPLVVDSDLDKHGTFVSGTGQKVQFRDILKGMDVDVMLIATQWRARDIVAEMAREGISAGLVLIEHGGRLIDFHRDPHPYARAVSS